MVEVVSGCIVKIGLNFLIVVVVSIMLVLGFMVGLVIVFVIDIGVMVGLMVVNLFCLVEFMLFWFV